MPTPTKIQLPNGLRVLLLETHQAPVASFNLWANVGSVNETDAEAGICHLIEHMIFKGTSKRPVGEIARSVEAAGGDMNAYTSFDETVFYINIPSRRSDLALDILADAASDPTFDEKELTREKEVVVEEISRAEDNPSQMATEDLFAKAFTAHPYRRPIAGTRETVRAISRDYLLQFFKRWYVGSNLLFVGVGDFKTNEILPKIEALLMKIPAGQPPAQKIPVEPPQNGSRITSRGMSVEGRYLDLGVPIPSVTDPDVPVLDVLAQILGGGASARMEQVIKEKKGLVTSIGCYAYTPRHPALFIIGSMLKDNRLSETVGTVWEEIERIKRDPPNSVELARARQNIQSGRIYERQTAQGMARKLSFFEGITGDWAFEEEYYRRVSQVSAEQVQELAQKYLREERLTLSFCHPKKEEWDEKKLRQILPTASPSKRPPVPRAVPASTEPQTHSFRLPNGIRLLVRENHAVPLIAIRSASLGGTRFETHGKNGLFHLLSGLLTKGTQHRTMREIAEESDNLSGHIEGYMGKNLLGLQGTFLAEKLTEGLDLFCDLLRNPSFPEEEIRKEIGNTLTAIRTEDDSLPTLTMKKFLENLYPTHPYGLPILGTVRSVRGLTRPVLLKTYTTFVCPANLVLSVVGDVSAEEIYDRIREKLGPWRAPRPRFPILRAPQPPSRPITTTVSRKKFQAHLVYGFLGTTVRDKDRYPLEVLNCVLAGQGGRLFLELRDKQGLAYAISSSSQEGVDRGTFAIYMGTDPAKLDHSIEGIRNELKKVTDLEVTEAELERAKRYIIGNFEIELQRNSTVAALIAFDELYGIGHEELTRYPKRIEAVTAADVLRVARKYIRPEASVLSVVKP